MEPDEIRHVAGDDDGEEGWERTTDEPDLRGVDVTGYGAGEWSVGVAVMEFIRDIPLEDELRSTIEGRLNAVPGVDSVESEDREVWFIRGSVDGASLAVAAAQAVDSLLDRTRAHYERLRHEA